MRMLMNKRALSTFLISSALAVACSDPPPPPPPPPPPMPEPVAPAPPVNEELEAAEVAYSYTPVGKRDPFKSIFEDLTPAEPVKITELQRFQIDQLKIAAIITGRATPYAMVEDPTGKGHTLTRGTLIGKNYGRVAAINPDCVVVKEEYRDYTGRKVTNEFSMCLPKPDDTKID